MFREPTISKLNVFKFNFEINWRNMELTTNALFTAKQFKFSFILVSFIVIIVVVDVDYAHLILIQTSFHLIKFQQTGAFINSIILSCTRQQFYD